MAKLELSVRQKVLARCWNACWQDLLLLLLLLLLVLIYTATLKPCNTTSY
jgi:uncharacterized integral membrane protein